MLHSKREETWRTRGMNPSDQGNRTIGNNLSLNNSNRDKTMATLALGEPVSEL